MSDSPLILLVEDEEHLAQGLLFNLQLEGFRTLHEADGDSALALLLARTDPDQPPPPEDHIAAVLLDCMLPGTSGFDIVRRLREEKRYIPVLLLTARSRPEDILEGLDAGADDYLPKPFELSMLLARLRTLLRRMAWHAAPRPAEPPNPPDEYAFNHRTIRFDTLELIAPNRITSLTLMESDLLRYLTERESQIVPRKDILENVWRVHEDTDTRAIDNFIVRLRRYIEDDPANPQHLLTVRGVGYRFLANPS